MQNMRGVAHATPRRHDGRYGVGVEEACDGQSKVPLVKNNGGLELSIEHIGEILVGYREVAEAVEVFLELRHAVDVAPLPGVYEPVEIVPSGIVDDSYYS